MAAGDARPDGARLLSGDQLEVDRMLRRRECRSDLALEPALASRLALGGPGQSFQPRLEEAQGAAAPCALVNLNLIRC
jgi:hypothetical protein